MSFNYNTIEHVPLLVIALCVHFLHETENVYQESLKFVEDEVLRNEIMVHMNFTER